MLFLPPSVHLNPWNLPAPINKVSFGRPTCLKFLLLRKRLFLLLLIECLFLCLGFFLSSVSVPNPLWKILCKFIARNLNYHKVPEEFTIALKLTRLPQIYASHHKLPQPYSAYLFSAFSNQLSRYRAFSISLLPHSMAFKRTKAVHILHWAVVISHSLTLFGHLLLCAETLQQEYTAVK